MLKHRLLDIRVAVRRGLRYMLARRMLQAILILPFLGLTLPIVTHPNQTLMELLRQSSSIVNLVLLTLVGLILRYRRQMRTWLDRQFFREAYQQEVILRRLMGSIKELDSMEQVSRLVCNELDSALHPKWLYLCQWKGSARDLAVVRAAGPDAVRMAAPAGDGLLELLKACKESRECAIADPAESGTMLVVPVSASNWNEGGALLLGERKSEEPYTQTDRNLLDAVAGAMAVVFENLRLKERVNEGLRERHEVLGRLDRGQHTPVEGMPGMRGVLRRRRWRGGDMCRRWQRTDAFVAGGAYHCATVSAGTAHRQGRHGCGFRGDGPELNRTVAVEGDERAPVWRSAGAAAL